MAANPKPASLIDLKNNHCSKAQIEQRERAEKALKCDERMQPSDAVKCDKVAYETFIRLKTLFSSIEMDDAFYESGLNRYCIMQGDHARLMSERAEIANSGIDIVERMTLLRKIDTSIAKLRDQMLSWERDNLMTVLAKLRAVPKQVQESDDDVGGVAAFMRGRA